LCGKNDHRKPHRNEESFKKQQKSIHIQKRNCQRHQQQQEAATSRDTAEMPTTVATAEKSTTERMPITATPCMPCIADIWRV
jgi:hypothetical protein